MKNLKALFILFLPAIILISCEKSDIKPRACGNETSITQPSSETEAPVNGRISSGDTEVTPESSTGDIVGGGDDDRDGGDKKRAGR